MKSDDTFILIIIFWGLLYFLLVCLTQSGIQFITDMSNSYYEAEKKRRITELKEDLKTIEMENKERKNIIPLENIVQALPQHIKQEAENWYKANMRTQQRSERSERKKNYRNF